MSDSLSGFFFDVEKWFGSIAAQRMSFSEKGVYLVSLFQEWRAQERNLPDDPQALAELIAVNDSQAAEVLAAFPSVRGKFVADRRAPGRMLNLALEKTRRKQLKFRKTRSNAGAEGGKRAAANRRRVKDLEASLATAPLQQNVALSREEKGREELSRDGKGSSPPPPTPFRLPGGTPPLQLGLNRFKVWRWQLDELIASLGTHVDRFDLDAWLQRVDRETTGIIPTDSRACWAWLQREFAAEVQRLGLPNAGGPTTLADAFVGAVPSKRPGARR